MRIRRALIQGLTAALCLGTAACAPSPVLQGADPQALKSLTGEIDGDRVFETILTLGDLHTRDTPIDCTNLDYQQLPRLCHLSRDLSRDAVQAQLEAVGLTVRHDDALKGGLFTSNLIAELPGTTRPEEIVLVGAHFDAFWMGADDNSSGIAAVLELARVLSQHRFARTIRFVGFDLEELYLVGSDRYVDTLPNDQIVTALIFDCIGYYSTAPHSQISLPGLPSPTTGDFLTAIGDGDSTQRLSEVYALNQTLGLMKMVTISPPRDGTTPLVGEPLMRSDHTPFWLTGRQAVFLTDTGNFRNPHYHTSSDTPETLDRASLTQAVRVAAATLAYWAGGPQ